MKLPQAKCKHGYTSDQLKGILGSRIDEFNKWMYGQTMTKCSGEKIYEDGDGYDYGDQNHHGCQEAHGLVVFTHDLKRFLAGLPVID
jgi:hypothetical protein